MKSNRDAAKDGELGGNVLELSLVKSGGTGPIVATIPAEQPRETARPAIDMDGDTLSFFRRHTARPMPAGPRCGDPHEELKCFLDEGHVGQVHGALGADWHVKLWTRVRGVSAEVSTVPAKSIGGDEAAIDTFLDEATAYVDRALVRGLERQPSLTSINREGLFVVDEIAARPSAEHLLPLLPSHAATMDYLTEQMSRAILGDKLHDEYATAETREPRVLARLNPGAMLAEAMRKILDGCFVATATSAVDEQMKIHAITLARATGESPERIERAFRELQAPRPRRHDREDAEAMLFLPPPPAGTPPIYTVTKPKPVAPAPESLDFPKPDAAGIRRAAEQISRAGGGSVDEVEAGYREIQRAFPDDSLAERLRETPPQPGLARGLIWASMLRQWSMRDWLVTAESIALRRKEVIPTGPALRVERECSFGDLRLNYHTLEGTPTEPVIKASIALPAPGEVVDAMLALSRAHEPRDLIIPTLGTIFAVLVDAVLHVSKTRRAMTDLTLRFREVGPYAKPTEGPTIRAEAASSDVSPAEQDRTGSPPPADCGPSFIRGPSRSAQAMIDAGFKVDPSLF